MTSTATLIHLSKPKDPSPGPGAYSIPDTFGYQTNRYTIHVRPEIKSTSNTAGYQALPSTIGTGPKKSLGCRHAEPKQDITPGPSYVPPAFGSDGHKAAFHGRPRDRALDVPGPGPGKYDTSSATAAPSHRYSMKARSFIPEEGKADGPGPGKYAPDYNKVLSSPRNIQISPRYTPRDVKSETPGPGQYPIDRSLDHHSSVFHRRAAELTSKDNFPGPKYDTSTKFGSESPRFSLRPRPELKNKNVSGEYQKIPDVFGTEGPKISLSSRHAELKREVMPGPNYAPPAFGSDVTKCSLSSRHPEKKAEEGSPGPGKYNTREEKTSGPKWSLKARNFQKDEGVIDGPGPGKYLPDYDKVLPQAPKTQIHVKTTSDKKPEPGPGYVCLPDPQKGPKFSIGRRDDSDVAPGVFA